MTPQQMAARIQELERERDGWRKQYEAGVKYWNPVYERVLVKRDALAARLKEAEDKIEGLEADLDDAVEVAYQRGATEWVRLNYPAMLARLEENPARAAISAQGET